MIYRNRACGALMDGNKVLMVYVVQPTRKFWTLPGGGIEPGETPEQACVREFKEETGLDVYIERFLFRYESRKPEKISETECFLVKTNDLSKIKLGTDPDKPGKQELKDIDWKNIDDMAKDIQISKLIEALNIMT